MRLKDQAAWDKYVEANQDAYGGCCVKVAREVMERMDELSPNKPVYAEGLVHDADRKLGEWITGFMAGAVASMVSRCHERGEEFRRSWNRDTQIDDEGDRANESGGVLNPALLNVGVDR